MCRSVHCARTGGDGRRGGDAANIRFVDVKPRLNGFFFKDENGNEYADAAAIEQAGKTAAQIKQIWYRPASTGFMLFVR